MISPREAKGLEFDGVVVLEPTAMLNHEHGRVGDLYVAMTRPTQRLRLIAAAGSRPASKTEPRAGRASGLPAQCRPAALTPGTGVTRAGQVLILLT